MVDSMREECGSLSTGGKFPENVCWNDVAKAAVEREEAARKEVIGGRKEVVKERCMEMLKTFIYQSKKKRKMNSLEGR